MVVGTMIEHQIGTPQPTTICKARRHFFSKHNETAASTRGFRAVHDVYREARLGLFDKGASAYRTILMHGQRETHAGVAQ
jgi:hypothetical protein